jgi:hypothetical protein
MMWCHALRLAAAAILLSTAAPLTAQAPSTGNESPTRQARPAQPRAQFFAGIVTELSSDQITVARNIVGRSPEKRTFLINKKTKMSKSLKVKSRVTVRYQHLPEGDIALEIQVRPSMHARST